MSDIFHAPGPRGIFGPTALCGMDATELGLWLTQIERDITCAVCRDLLTREAQ